MRQVAISSQFSIFVWIPPGPLVGVGSPGPPTLFYDVGVMAPELDTTRAFAASLSSLLVVGQLVNVVFICDLFLTFFRPLLLSDGASIKSHSTIAKHYLTGWFAVDLISSTPFEVITFIFVAARRTF